MKQDIKCLKDVNDILREFSCIGFECDNCAFEIGGTCMHDILIDITNAVYGNAE